VHTADLLLAAPRTPTDATGAATGVRIDVRDVGVTRNGHAILRDVNLSIEPGELVAIIGASGAGKSTLLDAIAGIRPPTSGTVHVDGVESGEPNLRHLAGYVPQDDIIHRDLPVAATVRYAARLRMPTGTAADEIDQAVTDTLARLDLTSRAATRVGDLSGGQRKRTSIAVELLTRPRAFFLDEPTSGLDPATAANLIGTLRSLADQGTTIVLTTHNTDDLRACDRIIVVAAGAVAFVGSPTQARDDFDVEHLADIYLRTPPEWSSTPTDHSRVEPASPAPHANPPGRAGHPDRPSAMTQWVVLARRNLDILRRNRLTLAIMLGAPVLVIAMFTMLFRPGALQPDTPDATAAISTTYWMAFAAFFFGLTYGLLQICTELPILRRETFVGLRIGPYVAAKITVLTPVLAAVNVAMLAVLRGLGRLPSLDAATYGRLAVTLVLTSVAALALGLLASAAVADAAQATLALPMLCFPAVLFAGAVLPVPTMDVGGRSLSVVVLARWTFEALGHELHLTSLLANDSTGTGPTLLAQYGDAFNRSTVGNWALLTVFTTVFLAGTAKVIRRRTAN
jgi:ABC-type multidrug transport system ATPase subunit